MSLNAHTIEVRYCSQHGITADRFVRHIRRRVLYTHARLMLPFILLFNQDYLTADDDFIRDVGRITQYSEYSLAVDEYIYHPDNSGMLHVWLKVRVSTMRMRKLVKQLLGMIPDGAADNEKSGSPFHATTEETTDSATPRQKI